MKELIISGDDEWITRLKAHLEKEHPKTKGKMWIKGQIEKKLVINNLKNSFKNIGNETKKALKPIDDVIKKIDDDLRNTGF